MLALDDNVALFIENRLIKSCDRNNATIQKLGVLFEIPLFLRGNGNSGGDPWETFFGG